MAPSRALQHHPPTPPHQHRQKPPRQRRRATIPFEMRPNATRRRRGRSRPSTGPTKCPNPKATKSLNTSAGCRSGTGTPTRPCPPCCGSRTSAGVPHLCRNNINNNKNHSCTAGREWGAVTRRPSAVMGRRRTCAYKCRLPTSLTVVSMVLL